MNIKEAIENIDNRVHCAMVEYNTSPEHDAYDEESLAIAIEAMKKQEVERPIREKLQDGSKWYKCQVCGQVWHDEQNYCHYCGQKMMED